MAITTMNEWTSGQDVHSGDEGSNGATVHSTKNAQDLEALLLQVVATLDEMKAQL